MKVVNKKLWVITITLLVVIECVFTYLSVKSYSNKDITELKEENKINKEMFAMYIENEDGNYEEYKDGESFTIAGYKLNISKSNCVDNKGNAVPDIINNSNNKVTVSSNKTVFCYLYFDKDKSVYAKVVSDYQNNNGAALLSGTESDAYPVHYYTGNITNNNIMYGGYCWKMVITTETGGVKLIYNGSPKSVVETEPIEESEYVVSTNTPTDKPFTFDSSTREWVSGIAGVNSTTNTIEFTVTEAGDYILNYTVDSEKNYDKGSFYLNGTALKSNISGTEQSGTIDLSDLTTTDVIKVTYVKDSGSARGSDTVKFSIGKSIGEGEKTSNCDNTGTDSQIGTSKFNSSNDSPAYVGYMYNNVGLQRIYTSFYDSINILKAHNYPAAFYYGNQAIWNEETNQYDLSNSDGSEVSTYDWSSNYSNLIGYYTCMSKTEKSCEKVYYVAAGESSYMYYYEMTNGNSYDSYKIKLATNITDNEDGTYTLVEPIELSKADWSINYSNYKGYYICSDLLSENCEVMYYIAKPYNYYIVTDVVSNNFKYGNSYTYSDGMYKLLDTKQFYKWGDNYNTLGNYHYTCFNTSGECSNLNFIYDVDSMGASSVKLSNGNSLDDELYILLNSTDVNKNDSTIKKYIDTWYENNLLETTDSNGFLYSKYLENTIFCASRKLSKLGAFDPNYVSGDKTAYFGTCENKVDQFTLKVEKGGTEGYGNNTLDYPIALISSAESDLAGYRNSYIKSGSTDWLMSPASIVISDRIRANVYSSSNLSIFASYVTNSYGVRPALSLSNHVEITGGDGSATNPYQVKLSE